MINGLRFHGCMPANILPFTADLAVDEPAYRKHLRWLADAPGVTGIVANGHAAEVASLARDERKETLAIAVDEVAGKVPVVAGVYCDGEFEVSTSTPGQPHKSVNISYDMTPAARMTRQARFRNLNEILDAILAEMATNKAK